MLLLLFLACEDMPVLIQKVGRCLRGNFMVKYNNKHAMY